MAGWQQPAGSQNSQNSSCNMDCARSMVGLSTQGRESYLDLSDGRVTVLHSVHQKGIAADHLSRSIIFHAR